MDPTSHDIMLIKGLIKGDRLCRSLDSIGDTFLETTTPDLVFLAFGCTNHLSPAMILLAKLSKDRGPREEWNLEELEKEEKSEAKFGEKWKMGSITECVTVYI